MSRSMLGNSVSGYPFNVFYMFTCHYLTDGRIVELRSLRLHVPLQLRLGPRLHDADHLQTCFE